MTRESIDRILKLFYAEARKIYDGTYYSKTTLTGKRFGLNRPYSFSFDIDIMNNPAFTYANKGFGEKCAELERLGFSKVEDTRTICEEDLQTL